MNFTSEQQAAIGARGRVIVSASAGSGKTAVMIERLVQLILGGVDVKNVLAVTFTNKAASQMREKLRSALIKRIASASTEERVRLKEQLNALPSADICTIHAFCGRLVRTNFFLADTDPAFRIIGTDDAEATELSMRALDETLEEEYEQGGENFQLLLSAFFRKKKDSSLRKAILDVYKSYRGLPNYRARLEQTGTTDDFDEVSAYLTWDAHTRAVDLKEALQEIDEKLGEGDENHKGRQLCDELYAAIDAVLSAPDVYTMSELTLQKISDKPRATKGMSKQQVECLTRLGACSAAVKGVYADVKRLQGKEVEREHYLGAQKLSNALCSLILRYDERYAALKKERGVLDYNDLEHCAQRVLSDGQALAALKAQYEYVFVDEYQDVNLAQERILSLLGGEEIFLVGDRKQAIYGFRGSKSEYFTQKACEYPNSLVLSENFRCSPAVLDCVNTVFERSMTKELCGFDYSNGSVMTGGRRFGAHRGEVTLYRYGAEKSKTEKRKPQAVYSVLSETREVKSDAQADAVVAAIERELGRSWYDADTEQERTVGYGDIAVLVRNSQAGTKRILAELSRRDIPVTSTAAVDVFSFWEIKLLVDWLSYLDNAEQDIPLVTALLSSIGGFCEEELATVRLRFPQTHFFREACRKYAGTVSDELSCKLGAFFNKVEALRISCRLLPAQEMLCTLLSEGLEGEIACKKDGSLRMRRVRRFLDEVTGSVHDTLVRISRPDFKLQFSEAGGEDAVKVVTMHASKGLEFPVVIMAGLGDGIHARTGKEIVWTERFLLSLKYYDVKKKLSHETVARLASYAYMAREDVKNDINLTYVAMTRARNRLYMLFGKYEPSFSPRYAKNLSDFIDQFALSELFQPLETGEAEACGATPVFRASDGELAEQIRAHYQKPYAYAESVNVPVKSSASKLMATEYVPSFGGKGGGKSTEEGTAYHAFLQHVNFGAGAASELDRMTREGLLSDEQIALVSVEQLEKILAMPVFERVKDMDLRREQKFLVLLQWDELTDGAASDEVVVQGALDLLCIGKDGVTLLDYKYSSCSDEQLKQKYALQISVYKKAIARALKIDERTVKASLVNICSCHEIPM